MGGTKATEKTFHIHCCLYFFLLSFCTGQITFELLDTDVNEVIFLGEEDVAVICSYAGDLPIDGMRIEDTRGLLLFESNNQTSIQYTFQRVQISDRELKCIVTLTCSNGRQVKEVTSLHLNIQNDNGPRCFRNGTVGQPYKDGDWFLVSCYCASQGNGCQWVLTDEGSSVGHVLSNIETIQRPGKEIQQVLVRYNVSTDVNVRYDCFVTLPHRRGTKRCSIGPVGISQNDSIIATPSSHLISCSSSTVTDIPNQEASRQFPSSDVQKVTNGLSTTPVFINLDQTTPSSSNIVKVVLANICIFIMLTLVALVLCRWKYKSDNLRRGEEFSAGSVQRNSAFLVGNANNTLLLSNGSERRTEHHNGILPSTSKTRTDNDRSVSGHAYEKKISNQDEVTTTLGRSHPVYEDHGDDLVPPGCPVKDSDLDTASLPGVCSSISSWDDVYALIEGDVKRPTEDTTISGGQENPRFQEGCSDDEQHLKEEGCSPPSTEEDFSSLYASINKGGRSEDEFSQDSQHLQNKNTSSSTEEDPSSLYAKVNKQRR